MTSALALLLLYATAASAQPEPVARAAELSVTPEGGSNRYRYVFELRSTGGAAEVVADRRLLRFEVIPEGSRSRRGIRCRHPAAPRRVDVERIRTLGPGADPPVWREWIDLRMYCWGRALRALDAGGTVSVIYGFDGRRANRTRWVARPPFPVGPDDEPLRSIRRRQDLAARAAVPSLAAAPLSVPPAPPLAAPPPGEAIIVSMLPADANGASTSFRVSLRSARGSVRIYPRWDLHRFRVSGPLGDVECAPDRQVIVPIIDFYRRIPARGRASFAIDSTQVCPDGTFDVEGIYEITPIVDLIYDGARYELEDVASGTFSGPPQPVRIRRSRRGYFEQVEDSTPRPRPGVT